ncbi:MAG TPA: hypothetical protein VKE98_14960 [Gemmataceae bacterium]|nr:hypothetical protein [Gemmataceae bacterium]
MPAAGSNLCARADRRFADPTPSPLAASGHHARRWFATVFDRTATASSRSTVSWLMVM